MKKLKVGLEEVVLHCLSPPTPKSGKQGQSACSRHSSYMENDLRCKDLRMIEWLIMLQIAVILVFGSLFVIGLSTEKSWLIEPVSRCTCFIASGLWHNDGRLQVLKAAESYKYSDINFSALDDSTSSNLSFIFFFPSMQRSFVDPRGNVIVPSLKDRKLTLKKKGRIQLSNSMRY
ncbi:hypothetical protein PoB_003149300 [Plakobranchus ocellatus]|uniref:Uncharacterized protein n=1 Tax=Plakobranchus ocellatus TaxID=259542 RepID=A0AAV4ACI5_9GAST|nr:hypothetical protein PoB_003149300 [Plakobranchus ocellatus]